MEGSGVSLHEIGDLIVFIGVLIGCIAGLVAILDYFGIKPKRNADDVLMPPSRRWKLGIMLALVAFSLGLASYSFYRSRRPRIVEKIVEKPVDRIVETIVPQKCPPMASPEKKKASLGSTPPTVGTLNQGAGSISQIGGAGNQATVNNLSTRPDPVFHWDQVPFDASASESRPGVTLTIWTDGIMDLPAFMAKCDRPCGNVSAILQGESQARYYSDLSSHLVQAFSFATPTSIIQDQLITWRIRSKDSVPIKIIQVERLPPDKWPRTQGSDKQFVPE
jgi:hypothetical protein